jgi:hypothetical protein
MIGADLLFSCRAIVFVALVILVLRFYRLIPLIFLPIRNDRERFVKIIVICSWNNFGMLLAMPSRRLSHQRPKSV